MKKFTASKFLVLASSVWIMLGSIALSSFYYTYLPAIRFAGVVLFFDSLLLIAVSFSCNATIKEKKWIMIEAAIDWLFSLLLLLDPVLTFFAFPFIVGPWIVTKGFITMIAAMSLRKSIHGWMGDLTGGFLLICCGFLISCHPLNNSYDVNILIGAIGWTIGLLYLYDAYRFRKINANFQITT